MHSGSCKALEKHCLLPSSLSGSNAMLPPKTVHCSVTSQKMAAKETVEKVLSIANNILLCLVTSPACIQNLTDPG